MRRAASDMACRFCRENLTDRPDALHLQQLAHTELQAELRLQRIDEVHVSQTVPAMNVTEGHPVSELQRVVVEKLTEYGLEPLIGRSHRAAPHTALIRPPRCPSRRTM